MNTCQQLLTQLNQGDFDGRLTKLYAPNGDVSLMETNKVRVAHVMEQYLEHFPTCVGSEVAVFSAPGRTEIGGNHTDHQHGCVLCASVNLDMIACASANDSGVVRIYSEGYPLLTVDLSDLTVQESEKNTSMALVRGVAAKIASMGYMIKGIDAYVTSSVLGGSGLSSSAAYEVLMGDMFNHFCCDGEIDPITIAKIGQYAENYYFGKMCGLMDQTGSSVGGVVAIDFCDPTAPVVKKVDFDFATAHHALCIVDTMSDHADLSDDYSMIPQEMTAVAELLGAEKLRHTDESKFWAAIPELRKSLSDRAIVRAIHFFADNKKAQAEAAALEAGDFQGFLNLINASGISSATHLQNIWVSRTPENQAVTIALAMADRLLDGVGASRVHGGGFAGTIQAFVPYEKLDGFKAGMDALLGDGACHVLHIRQEGGIVVFH